MRLSDRALPLAPLLLPWAVFVVVSLSATSAHAYEDRVSLGLELGYAAVVVPDTDLPPHGVMAGLAAGIGLGDQFALNAHLAYALHPSTDLLQVGLFGVEGIYLLDVVQVVPFFGLGIDGLVTAYQGSAGLELGFHAVLGADYLLSRQWVIGLDIRPHVLPVSVAEGRLDPVYITANLRVSYLFEI